MNTSFGKISVFKSRDKAKLSKVDFSSRRWRPKRPHGTNDAQGRTETKYTEIVHMTGDGML